DNGRQAIEAHFGDAVETVYVENVAEGADAERVIRQLAAGGADLIFTTSFGFMNATARVAEQFPDVKFEHATGYVRADNLSTYAARFYEGRTVAGLIAGRMTETNVLGYIGSFPIPEVVQGINAFMLAAQKVNPDVTVKIIWANTWYDPGTEADAARALIDQGADIISQHTDSPAALQVAQERGVYGFGQASDMVAFAPDAQLTALVDNWDQYYIDRVQAVIDGTWESTDTWGGMDSGMVELSPFNAEAIPADVLAEAEALAAQIMSGEVHSFAGPITNQAGELVIGEGEVLDDEAILTMDWYIQGIDDQLPN
ncbi:MAG: BMP family ABC transporter substrate-binding protein, partial [Alphaproteobacteria bacterium]